jgi:hypothetical protein
MKKIIFLDIDGVVVNRRSLTELRNLPRGMEGRPSVPYAAAKECIEPLNAIFDAHSDARLVISSTWRLDNNLKRITHIFEAWGIRIPILTPTWKTPRLIAQSRGKEIQAWMDEHGVPESFVILDDDSDMEHLSDRLVLTKFEVGLTMPDATRAIGILNASREGAV